MTEPGTSTTRDAPDTIGQANAGAEPILIQEDDRNRWAAKVGTETIGALTYQFAGGRYVLVSTFVAEAYRHRGLASKLVSRALDDIRRTGKTITVICPFVGDFIGNHPDYADLIDPVHPGRGAYGSEHDPAPAPASAEPGADDSAPTDSATRIMVLGAVVHRGPVSPADIASAFEEWAIRRWASISAPEIGEQLRALSSSELIAPSDAVDGNERFHATDAGRAELRRALLALLNAEEFRPFNVLPLLHFVTSLGVAELADGMRRRILAIDEVLAHDAAVIEHAPADGPDRASEIARLNWQRFDADRTWSLAFVGRLYGAES